MASPSLERAYASAAIVAQGLKNLGHPGAGVANELKEAVARAVVNPDFVNKPEFGAAWDKRRELAGLRGSGEVWDAVTAHVAALVGTQL